jgi:hypothetical protein
MTVIGGKFITASGSIIRNVAKWDGTSWSALGEGISNGVVYSMAIQGSSVYVGGNFNTTNANDAQPGLIRYQCHEIIDY